MDKIILRIPVIVEGKYDKARLSQVIDGVILTTDGFGIFKHQEKMALIRRLGEEGVILLCDSDGAGKVIRSHLKSCLPPEKVFDLYTPQIHGKEKRKAHASKEGFLGVEGMDNTLLRSLFARFAQVHPHLIGGNETGSAPARRAISKADLYTLGLTGTPDAADRRNRLCQKIGFPADMTPNALLSALQLLYTVEEIEEILP
ncbi:MAG: DUF4093 domain-containing protein [Clostridia bacterium]|nr:DUF4093 domain-containing protein [Clostridia bacterium]